MPSRSITMVGDVLDENGFGGSPFRFFQACEERNFAQHAWQLDLGKLKLPRLFWNLGQLLRGRRYGGFQYTDWCARILIEQIPTRLLEGDIISFHQNFPPCGLITRAGGTVNFYIDATYTQLFSAYSLDKKISVSVLREAIAREREAFRHCERVIASQSWAYRSLVEDYQLPTSKVFMILPAANLELPENFQNLPPTGKIGIDRPLLLGFIGMDWRRKGLDFLMSVREELVQRGWKASVRAMGFDGQKTPYREGIQCLGFIDKKKYFLDFINGVDIGCLFSNAEAAGIAVFEFLRCGVPVAGFTVNGLHDLLPPDAGFRFNPGASVTEVADVFESYLRDEKRQHEYRSSAARWSPLVTWERCVREFEELWATGSIRNPVQPWRGLSGTAG